MQSSNHYLDFKGGQNEYNIVYLHNKEIQAYLLPGSKLKKLGINNNIIMIIYYFYWFDSAISLP